MSRPHIHPLQALFGAHEHRPSLPVCDHYAGVEPRMRKALALQSDMGDTALFDVTLDLEDGAPVGGEQEHALLAADLKRQLDRGRSMEAEVDPRLRDRAGRLWAVGAAGDLTITEDGRSPVTVDFPQRGQAFVINPDLTVEAAAKEAGVEITGYARVAVGEGIEKKSEDFAAEVAKALQG